MMRSLGVTFLIPVLNEATTLPLVLRDIAHFRRVHMRGRPSEVLVSDNGSTDGSQAIARRAGARVVQCPIRGYGAAVRFGIAQAKFPLVIFADADATYDFKASGALIKRLDEGADLVLSSRLTGTIEAGAMPWTHRHIGTPALTWAINLLHNRGAERITDCNAGHRGVRRDAHQAWGCRSDGMEYASELVVEALRHGAKVCEVKGTLAKDQPGRKPHMRTWRDGMRNVLQIMVVAPGAFSGSGAGLWGAAWAVLALGLVLERELAVGPFYVLGLHSMLFALLGTLVGMAVWSVGLFLGARDPRKAKGFSGWLLKLPEDQLFWLGALGGGLALALIGGIVLAWSLAGFAGLHLERQTVAVVAFAVNVLLLLWNTFCAHLLKRLWRLEDAALLPFRRQTAKSPSDTRP